jgi:L-ascorbate metabolism protein UlaG (beta-lactamase superfamily)
MTHRLKWLGHSACQITTEKGKIILIDPWITGNPSCPISIDEITHTDLIMVTHDHYDHLGTDIPELVKTTGATVVAQREVAGKLQELGVGAENIINGRGMNIGGRVQVAGIEVTMVQAVHSSLVGSPAGYIIKLEDGKTVYHAGDTGIFSSMSIFGELYQIDLALLPIGSVFVMDPLQAAYSLTMLKPKKAIPIHYRTFPILVQDADEFIKLSQEKAPNVEIVVLEPGKELLF